MDPQRRHLAGGLSGRHPVRGRVPTRHLDSTCHMAQLQFTRFAEVHAFRILLEVSAMARCESETKKGIPCGNAAVKGSKFCRVHGRRRFWRRVLSFSAIGAIVGLVADVLGIFGFLSGASLPSIHREFLSKLLLPLPPMTAFGPQASVELIAVNGSRITVTTDDRVLSSGDTIRTQQSVTVTFRILNNGPHPATIRSILIGARGPGVSCKSRNREKWAALNSDFPSAVAIRLDPGQEYEYRGSRAFYKPGVYFLEPVFQDSRGVWGGIPPFSCIDIYVDELR
jgi:hypothetical protein